MKLFGKIDKTVFGITVLVYLCIFLYILLFPQAAETYVHTVMDFTLNSVGFVYILAYAFILIVFVGIGLSKYGRLRLGGDDEKPEFSFFSWMGMLFGAGLGVGLVFYGVTEPVSHFMAAPFAESGTAQAAADAMRTTFFHWSFLPWAVYGVVGLCMGYFLHRKGLPCLISSSFRPMLGERISRTPGKMIDAFSLIAVISGVSMSLGFACTQLVSGMNLQYGVPGGFAGTAVAIVGIGLIATLSAVSGVEKGIKYISDGNMVIVIFFLLFALTFGSTRYLIGTFFQGLGDLVFNLPWMLFFLDSYGIVEAATGSNWIGGWTIMYWAWWVAFAPFVGGFLARISRGRTIREFVLACTFVPGVLCCIWFTFFGGEAIAMDLFGGGGIGDRVMENTDNSLFVFLSELPVPAVTIPVAMLLIVTLIVTSVNSATYVAGQFSAGGEYVPSLGIRAFWGVFIALNAILFISIGGLDTLRNTAIVLAFPFSIITVLMVLNLIRDMRQSDKESTQHKAGTAQPLQAGTRGKQQHM